MAEFTVTATEVRSKASELKELNAKYKNVVEELEQEVTKLSSMWEGEAHDAFDATFKTDKAKLDLFYNAIEKYCFTLDEVAANYQQAESKNVTTASTK
jgi:WXG100 family type VII secretion target